MRFALLQLRNVVMAFAVLLLGMVVVAAPAGAADSALPSGYYLCHATGSASTPEGVKNWVYNSPSDSGQASGHAGPAHQSALDIIPPIPGVLPNGQNWTTYGQQVHANQCNIPTYIDVNATFTDQRCQANGYVPPAFDAPTYAGLTRTVSGLGDNNTADAGETVTVTYTGSQSAIINGAPSNTTSFTHTFPSQPSGLSDCVAQPPAETRTVPRSEPSCALGGVSHWVDVYTTPYVWSDAQQKWVPGQETGPVRTNETFEAYGDNEYFRLCAPDKPAAKGRTVPMSSPSCDPAGVTSWNDVYTTEYVWSAGQRAWVLGQETGPVKADETFTAYTDEEFFEACADEQPQAETRSVPQSEPSCALGGVTSWNDVYTTEHVWNAGQRAWVLGQETGPVKADETFTAYNDDEFFQECAPAQPAVETRSVPRSERSCDLGGVTAWDDVFTTEYVWSAGERRWLLGEETGPVRSGVTFSPYTDEEFFELCAPAQPQAEARTVPQSEPSCALGGVTSWNDVYTTEYVWNATERDWVAGQETGPVRTGESFEAYTDAEYRELCADEQPAAETRSVPRSERSCDLGGVTAWDDVFTTEYVWSAGERRWLLGEETGPVRSGVAFSPYTDEEFFELCAPAQPQAEERRVPQHSPSCELGGVESWVDVFTTDYEWNAVARAWEKGPETGPVQAEQDFTAYTDQEYFNYCSERRPAPELREVARTDASCQSGGVTSWTDVYTTPYVWNAGTRAWEKAAETGPVKADETFTAYTDDEFFELCAGVRPAAEQRRQSQSVPSCDLSGVTSWDDVYTTEFVWNVGSRAWERGVEAGPVPDGEQFTPYSDDDFFELCAPAQPDPIVREVAGAQASCKIRGTESWVDVYTTEYVWNVGTRAWELGEESGPVRTDQTFVAYGDEELAASCTEVEGGEPPAVPEVDDPAAPSVPTVVNAGVDRENDPSGQSRDPLWLLAIGGGLGLMGAAGLRRRATANRLPTTGAPE